MTYFYIISNIIYIYYEPYSWGYPFSLNYSIDYNNTDLNRVSRETFKEFVKQETSTRQFGNGTSGNVVYWYDDKGGMFFVNSC